LRLRPRGVFPPWSPPRCTCPSRFVTKPGCRPFFPRYPAWLLDVFGGEDPPFPYFFELYSVSFRLGAAHVPCVLVFFHRRNDKEDFPSRPRRGFSILYSSSMLFRPHLFFTEASITFAEQGVPLTFFPSLPSRGLCRLVFVLARTLIQRLFPHLHDLPRALDFS